MRTMEKYWPGKAIRSRGGRAALVLLLLAAVAAPGPRPAWSAVDNAPGGGVLFTHKDPYAGNVFLAGDFNAWSAGANPMVKNDDGIWTATVSLPPGEHQYKFVVDGQWTADPTNPVTGGDFGNSVVTVGPDGKVVAMKATSNTELSPKIFLGSRYVVLMQDRKVEGSNPQWNLDRPNYDIDLDFDIRVNEDLTAHVLTNINNANQNVQLWETNLTFDRGSLLLQNADINLLAFDNDSVGTWNDPLHIVGDIGIYHHPWGFNQQGATAWRKFGNYEGRLLYSDNFQSGGQTSPAIDPFLDALAGQLVAHPDDPLPGSFQYAFNRSENNKNVLAARVTGPVRGNLTAGLSYRLDRGLDPGALGEVIDQSTPDPGTRVLTLRSFPGTVESWQGGGGDLRYHSDPQGIDLYGEFLAGKKWISTGTGDLLRVTYTNIDTAAGTADRSQERLSAASPESPELNSSKRFKLGGEYFAYRGWHWTGSVEFQDEDITDRNGPPARRYNRMTVYRTGVRFSGDEWKRWPWEAGLEFEYFDFNYAASARWTDQFWFDDRNFWLENGEHLVSVDRLVLLGGNNVATWRPHFRWMFYAPRHASVEYRGVLNTTRPDRKPKYWGNQIALHVDLNSRLGLNTDSRIARYDDPVLNLKDTFTSHFVELKYKFTPDMNVGLSWGVDPWVIDPLSNQYAHIGRDLFLFQQGATGDAAKTRFLDMTDTVRRAEQQLEDEKRIQLEAIITF